ncbi:MAG: hypothetical protein JW741_00760 [Sedimentisphaerales bacterium]|nr:hypothetical protein [Sedimentisphaerales bacterium]
MRRLLSILLLTAVFSGPASGMLLIQQEDTWEYSVLDFDLLSVWTEVEYADFDWDGAPWSDGQAAFGNGSVPVGGTINTDWKAGTDLALRTSFEIATLPTENLRLDLAVDNGCVIFINGHEVLKHNAEYFTTLWEYSTEIAPSSLTPGTNTVSVLAEDHGLRTYFDMQLQVVPEPATIALLALAALLPRRTRP